MLQYIASSRPNLINVVMRVKEGDNLTQASGIVYMSERFEVEFLSRIGLESSNLSMIYVCGSPIMNAELLYSLDYLGVSQHQIFIL